MRKPQSNKESLRARDGPNHFYRQMYESEPFLKREIITALFGAAGFGRTPQRMPFVQLSNHLLHRPRHGLEAPLSASVNVVGAFKRDDIAIPVGAFPAGWRLYSLDRYDLEGLLHC